MASNVVVVVLAESEVRGDERLVLLVMAELAGVMGDVDAGLRGLARLCRMEVDEVQGVIERLVDCGAVEKAGKGKWKIKPGMGREGARGVLEAAGEGRGGKRERKAFVKPSVEEVVEYAKGKGWVMDGEECWLHYEKCGWRTRAGAISSWKAAVALWAKREERGDFTR